MKKSLAVVLALIMVLCMIPTTALAANGTGHQISVNIYKVVLDSSKPLGYQTPELVKNITVTCQDGTAHSGYNHSVYLNEFYPDKVGLSTTDWTGWQFNSYYEKGKDNATFYNWKKDTVNATANVTGSEPYPCSKNFYLVYKEANPQPNQPTDAEIKGLVGNGNIKVKCTTANTAHLIESYSLLDGSYTTGAVIKDGNTYTCTITVGPAQYVAKYNETNGDHTLSPDGQSGSITFEWKNNSWALAAGQNLPITFTVVHNTQEPPTDKPERPEPENTSKPFIELTGEEAVKVHCANDNANHADKNKSYGLMHDGYTVGEVQGDKEKGYTCDITVKPEKYVAQYNLDIGVEHTLDPELQADKIIKLKWNNEKWELASVVPVVFTVKCDNTQPPLDKTITIEVSKIWEDDIAGAQSITVGLYANGTKVDEKNITPNGDIWYNKFEHCPLKDDNGKDISYTIVEEPIDGYTPHYFTSGEHGGRLVFRVKNVPTDNTGAIRVSKELSGEGADKNKEFAFTVTLLEYLDSNEVLGGGDPGYYPLSGIYTFGGFEFRDGKVTFGLKGGDSVTISGIPAEYDYTVTESDNAGYTVTSENDKGTIRAKDTAEVKFTNTKSSTTGNGSGHSHYHPYATPVPVTVIPPKTGDMTIWQSILHFLGIR